MYVRPSAASTAIQTQYISDSGLLHLTGKLHLQESESINTLSKSVLTL